MLFQAISVLWSYLIFFFLEPSLISMLIHTSFSCRMGCESESNHPSHLLVLVKLVAFCSSTRVSPPRQSVYLLEFKLLRSECSFAYLVEFFCSLPHKLNRKLVAPLSHTRIHHHNLSETRVSGECCDIVTQCCHHNFTHSGAQLSCTAPMAASGGVGHSKQQCALAARPWCRPSGGTTCELHHTHCTVLHWLHCAMLTVQCCTVNCVQMYNISHVHSQCVLHFTALYSWLCISAALSIVQKCTTLQTCTSTALHCSAFQYVYFSLYTLLHCTVQLFNMCTSVCTLYCTALFSFSICVLCWATLPCSAL